MIAPARRFAFRALTDVELRGAYSDYALHGPVGLALEPRDHRLATELVYGTLRWQSRLDHVLASASNRSLDALDPEVRIALRMALYQLWHIDRIPAYAGLSDAVELAKGPGRGGDRFVNAVLRRLARERPWEQPGFEAGLLPWVRVSLPEWLWVRWAGRYGPEAAEEYARSLNEAPPRVVRLSGSAAGAVQREPGLEMSEVVPGAAFARAPGGGDGSAAQDEASQLVPRLLGEVAGLTVWDACAAPGGKTEILLEGVGPTGRVVATELHRARIRRLGERFASRAGWNVDLVQADAASVAFRRQFDAVLVDAPCTGLGTLRRNPEIKWRRRPEDPARMAVAQHAILTHAARAVRPGGRILYSTCSTEPEENENVVTSFLACNADYRLARPAVGRALDAWIDTCGALRTFPGTRGWDGFFAALITRDS